MTKLGYVLIGLLLAFYVAFFPLSRPKHIRTINSECRCPPPLTEEEIREQQKEELKARLERMFHYGGIGD